MSVQTKCTKTSTANKHFYQDIKLDLQEKMKKMYKTSDVAFSDIDFSGKGYVTQEDFFKILLIYKLKYSKSDLMELFDREAAFKRKVNQDEGGMNPEIFKRYFFPPEALRYENPMKRMVKAHENVVTLTGNESKEEIKDKITNKLKHLDQILKKKFENNWVSVK